MNFKTLKPLLLSAIVVSTNADARELAGFSNLEFGMSFNDVKALTEHKPDFEVWQKEADDEDHLRYSVLISGMPMTARAFFKEGVANGFNVSSRVNMASESKCIDRYLHVIGQLEQRYGQVTNPAVSQGILYSADFGFSNNRHIHIFGNYDGIIDKCHIVVKYENSPLTKEAAETTGTKTTGDTF